MGTANLAMGNSMFPQPPYYAGGIGIRTPWGVVLPPYSRIAAVVRSTGVQDLDDPTLAQQLVPDLATGLARCRSGKGDYVLVLPGHTENVTATTAAAFLANLKAGTRILGIGDPSLAIAPKFTWTADATWAISVADVVIQNLNLQMNGTDDITAGITITGAGVRILGCNINTGTGASLDAVLAILTGTGCSNLVIAGCKSRQTSGTTTSVVKIAVGADVTIADCDFQMIGSAAGTGVINISAAATLIRLVRCVLENHHASSTAAVSVADAAITGTFEDLRMVTLNDGTVTAQGVVFAGTTPTVKLFDCKCVDEPRTNAALSPAACT